MRRSYIFSLLIFLFASICYGTDLTKGSLAGKWIFKYMILDGDIKNKSPVNLTMEFLSDGQVINYSHAGEKTFAKYKIDGSTIIYTDKRGKQNWKLKSFSGNKLHVDHSGAEMFFDRK